MTDIDDPSSSPRLDEIQREYLEDLRHRATPAHHRNVEGRITKTLAAIDAEHVDDLKPLALIRYRNKLQADGLSNRSANLVIDNLRTMLTWACECGLIEVNPIGKIRRLPDGAGHQRYVRRALGEDEIRRFLEAAEEDDCALAETWPASGGGRSPHGCSATRIPQAPMWRAFLETGARWSELTRTRWADVDCDERTLLLRAENTKSRRRRIVPLGSGLVDELSDLRRLHGRSLPRKVAEADRVFLTPEGVHWCRPTNNAMRIFNRLLTRAEIPRVDAEGRKLDIHALRHTFGTRMARSGAGLVHVQRLLGHSDPKLTAQVYTHLDVEDLRGAIEGAIGS